VLESAKELLQERVIKSGEEPPRSQSKQRNEQSPKRRKLRLQRGSRSRKYRRRRKSDGGV